MKQLVFLLCLALFASIVQASNLRYLKDTPISEFTETDTIIFEKAVVTALNNKKDGEKLAWRNEQTGTSGLVNPLKTYKENNETCRHIRTVNRAKNKIAENVYKFCKRDDHWVAVGLVNNK